MADYVSRAVADLDRLLLAVVECQVRTKEYPSISSITRINVDDAGVIKEASAFLKAKGYPNVSVSRLIYGLVLLQADADGLLPPDKN